MGIAFDGLGNSTKALNTFLEALRLNEELGLKTEISSNLHSIGEIYADKGDYASALPYFKKALAMAIELNNKRSIGIISDGIGTLYLNCPESLLKQEGIESVFNYGNLLFLKTIAIRF